MTQDFGAFVQKVLGWFWRDGRLQFAGFLLGGLAIAMLIGVIGQTVSGSDNSGGSSSLDDQARQTCADIWDTTTDNDGWSVFRNCVENYKAMHG
jgi:hypothetical protein